MAKKKKAGFTGRKSKVDPFAGEVGHKSDKDIAALAGVSLENVRTWRKRRGIPAYWKGEGGDAPAAAKASKPAAPKKRTSAKKPRRRKSKLDPFLKELGKVPDSQIAAKSGTSVENVRAYRKRHRIAASWKQAETQAAAPAAATPVRKASPPRAAVAAPRRAPATARNWAFRVTAQVGGAEKEYVTFGADVVEAAQVARDRLAVSHKEAFVQKIEVLGVAL